MTTPGERLRALRTHAGLSLRELGKRAQIDHAYLARMEADKAPSPVYQTVARIARELGVSTDTLMQGERDAS